MPIEPPSDSKRQPCAGAALRGRPGPGSSRGSGRTDREGVTLNVVLGCSTAPLSAAENLPCRRPQAPAPIPGRQRPADSTWGEDDSFRCVRPASSWPQWPPRWRLSSLAPRPPTPRAPRNYTELTGRDVDRVGCYELVWVDGVGQDDVRERAIQGQGAEPPTRQFLRDRAAGRHASERGCDLRA
jgi:hypothetical protein